MEQIVAQILDQVQQQAPTSGGIGADGWKVISFLLAGIGGMFLWLKLKDKKIDDLQDARVDDLKESAAFFRDDKDKDNGKS